MIRRYKRLLINSACFFLLFSQVIFIGIAQDQSTQQVEPGSQDKTVLKSTVESGSQGKNALKATVNDKIGSQGVTKEQYESSPPIVASDSQVVNNDQYKSDSTGESSRKTRSIISNDTEYDPEYLLISNMQHRVYSEFYWRMSWYTYNSSHLDRKEAESYLIYYNAWYITKVSAKIYYLVDSANTLMQKKVSNEKLQEQLANLQSDIAKLDQELPGIWNEGFLNARIYTAETPLTNYKLSQGKYSTSDAVTQKYKAGDIGYYDHKSTYNETRYDVYVRIMDKLDVFLNDFNKIKAEHKLK